MSEWSCVAGSTLLVPSGPHGNHLFIVLNNPKDFDGYLNSSLLVGISTIKTTKYDNTCVLKAGVHSFIKNDSYVVYRDTRIERVENLIQGITSNTFIPHEPVSGEILAYVRNGLFESKHTPNYLKNFTFN